MIRTIDKYTTFDEGKAKQVRLQDGIVLLISYQKCIAAWSRSTGHVKSKHRHSRQMQKHLEQWVEDDPHGYLDMRPQVFFDHLLAYNKEEILELCPTILNVIRKSKISEKGQ